MPATPARLEDPIPDALFEALPEIDPRPRGAPFASPSAPRAAVSPGAMFAELRRELERAFSAELDRASVRFSGMLRDLETQLAQARLDLESARLDVAHLRSEQERRAETLRELKRAIETL